MSGSEAGDLSPVEDDLEIIEENENIEQNEQNNETEEGNENQEDAAQADSKKEVKVKRVRNPQPKLNVERLKGPRGLQMLGKVFQDVKFKGRGHEEEDLCVLMKNYEYWCHRLFPKFPFDDCLERMEKLGAKKPLQTYIKRIRMDLLLDDDVEQQQQQEDEAVNGDAENSEEIWTNNFDDLLPRQTQTQTQPQPTSSGSTGLSEDQLERIRINRERAQRLRQQMLIRNQPSSETLSQTSSENNTEEQLERIRVNREKAQKLRQQTLIRNHPSTESLSQTSSQLSNENHINTVSSQTSSICNALKDIDFTENMSVDTANFTSQNSIEGESFCFQTTAIVHESPVSERIGSEEMMSIEYASPKLLDDAPIVSEITASQNSVDPASLDNFGDEETIASQESSTGGANNHEESLLKDAASQESVENMLVDCTSQDLDRNMPPMLEAIDSQNSIDSACETTASQQSGESEPNSI